MSSTANRWFVPNEVYDDASNNDYAPAIKGRLVHADADNEDPTRMETVYGK
ncbi:hypothetical protein MMC07_000035 [Pseudocyphellaria aurata]|nr:hypothetical protein [Pseudocyphellaria aurata]